MGWLELVDEGEVPTTSQVCRRARVSRKSAWLWHRDPRFLAAFDRIVEAQNDPINRIVDRATQRRAMKGVPSAVEANLRLRGKWNTERADAGDPTGNPTLNAPGSVMFFGIPKPPTPQEAEAMRPPVGSNIIIPAPQLPPAGGAK